MIEINETVNGRNLSIKLKNGIYVFPATGGTGKSFVADMLKALDLQNVSVIEYNSNRDLLNSAIFDACSKKYDLVYMDRTDMYMDSNIFSKLLDISDSSTVVLDMKKRPDYTYDVLNVATIHYGKRGVFLF
jgi:hypothetical protein